MNDVSKNYIKLRRLKDGLIIDCERCDFGEIDLIDRSGNLYFGFLETFKMENHLLRSELDIGFTQIMTDDEVKMCRLREAIYVLESAGYEPVFDDEAI